MTDNKEKIAAMEAAATQAVLDQAADQAKAIMAEAVGRANAILVAAEREATEVERLAAIRAAEMALIANPPRRITVPVAWEEFCGYGYGNFNRDVCQDVTIEMATREVVDATVPKWSSSALSKHKLRDVLKVGDVLPADSREWGRALGL